MSAKDAKELVRLLRRKGADVRITGSTHYRVTNPRNSVSITIAVSPSDRRWKYKVRRDVKRLGLEEV